MLRIATILLKVIAASLKRRIERKNDLKDETIWHSTKSKQNVANAVMA